MTVAESTPLLANHGPSLRRAGWRVMLGIAAGLVVLYALALAVRNVTTLIDLQAERLSGTVEQGDFEDYVAFYAGGKLVLEGRGSDLYNIESISAEEREIMGREVGGTGTLAFFNPPFVALLFTPVALLPVGTAALVLLCLNLILLLVTGSVLRHQLQIRGLWRCLAFWLAVLSFQPVFWLVGHNQLSMLLVLGFLGFYVFEKQDKPRLAGFALLLLLVKPQATLLAVAILAWKRQWAVLVPFTAVGVSLVLLSVTVSGISVLWHYPRFLLDSAGWEGSRGVDIGGMYGWNGFFATLLPYGEPLYVSVASAMTIATVGTVLYTLRGPWRPESSAFPLAIGVLCLGSLLINPHVYLQDTVVVGLSLALGWLGWQGKTRTRALWLAIVFVTWALASRTMRLQADSDLNLFTPVIALMFVTLAAGVMRQRSRSARQAQERSQMGIARSKSETQAA